MGTVLIVLFGVLLPAITLAIELATGMCAQAFFDPIPTPFHVVLVALVPVVNLLALVASKQHWPKWRTPLLWANGVALGIALVYTLAFAVLMPVAVIAILVYGMGLLPLAPFFSLMCGLGLRRRITKIPLSTSIVDGAVHPAGPRPSSLKSLLIGGAVGILLLVFLEARNALTIVGAQMAASESPEQVARGVKMLRTFGSSDVMLRLCYQDAGRRGPFSFGGSNLMSGFFLNKIPRDKAQQAYFRVMGEPYNAVPPPRSAPQAIWNDFDFDPDQGGTSVSGRLKGLSLSSSRLDAQLHPDAAVSYTEWTMEFQNDRDQQREVRAQVLLPPGGVVSRVTLWINGEPREAAFAGSSQVREAYQRVVAQRRDPLLVTWAGIDRVLVQCFPVPGHGSMKIRLGITAPMTITDPKTTVLRLPCFAERNFNVASRDIHSLWVESDSDFQRTSDRLQREKPNEAKHILRGTLADDELAFSDSTIVASRNADVTECWTPGDSPNLRVNENGTVPLDSTKKIVLQKIIADQPPAKKQFALVIDGSQGITEYIEAIAEAIAAIPEDAKLRIYVAGDEVVDVSDAGRSNKGPNSLVSRLRSAASVGGCDNVPALLKAFEATGDGDKTIVWIHAAQPVLLQPATPLVQWLERDTRIQLYDMPVVAGPNRLLDQLGSSGSIKTISRSGSVCDDLKDLFARLTGQAKEYRMERTCLEAQPPDKPKASSHVARLWAAGQVTALTLVGKQAQRAEAVKLAADFQLVTPVSGAVVLENQKQYEDSKLKPVDPDTSPGTPEPATWIMLLVTLPWLIWAAWKRWRGN